MIYPSDTKRVHSVSPSSLEYGKKYIVHTNGSCKGMESESIKTFVGFNNEKEPLFFDEDMKTNVSYSTDIWTFYNLV